MKMGNTPPKLRRMSRPSSSSSRAVSGRSDNDSAAATANHVDNDTLKNDDENDCSSNNGKEEDPTSEAESTVTNIAMSTHSNETTGNTKSNALTKNNDAVTTNNDTNSSKRIRRPPKKYIARPSKQGLGVEEGDALFLADDWGGRVVKKSPVKKSAIQSGSVKSSTGIKREDGIGFHTGTAGSDSTMNHTVGAVTATDGGTVTHAATSVVMQGSKRKRESTATINKNNGRKRTKLLRVRSVEEDTTAIIATSAAMGRRTSAISRRYVCMFH